MAPPWIEVLGTADGNVQFSFLAEFWLAYRVEYREAATTGPWQSLTNLADFADPVHVVVRDPVSSENRFYRVILP